MRDRVVQRWLRCCAAAWLLAGRPSRAIAALDRSLARWPTCRHALASRAHLLAARDQRDAAQADLSTLVRHHPGDAAAWFNLGFLLEAGGQLESALHAFQRAAELDDSLDRAWYGQGLVLIQLQRLDDAALALQRVTELQPMSPFGWYQLARVQSERRRPDDASRIIGHLQAFEPAMAAQLRRETGLQGVA